MLMEVNMLKQLYSEGIYLLEPNSWLASFVQIVTNWSFDTRILEIDVGLCRQQLGSY